MTRPALLVALGVAALVLSGTALARRHDTIKVPNASHVTIKAPKVFHTRIKVPNNAHAAIKVPRVAKKPPRAPPRAAT